MQNTLDLVFNDKVELVSRSKSVPNILDLLEQGSGVVAPLSAFDELQVYLCDFDGHCLGGQIASPSDLLFKVRNIRVHF